MKKATPLHCHHRLGIVNRLEYHISICLYFINHEVVNFCLTNKNYFIDGCVRKWQLQLLIMFPMEYNCKHVHVLFIRSMGHKCMHTHLYLMKLQRYTQ